MLTSCVEYFTIAAQNVVLSWVCDRRCVTGGACDFYAHVKTVDSRPRKFYGAPVDVWIRYTVRSSTKTPGTAARLHSYIVVRVLKCMSALCTNLSKCIIEVMLW